MNASFDYKHFLKTAPKQAGVYLMYDVDSVVIYVGKAKNLKNRLSSYFLKTQLSAKTTVLVSKVMKIEVIVTQTETEALILENNLIKAHKPRYNISLIDDKSYPYIHISDHVYPRISHYRGRRKKSGKLFGPYPSVQAVVDTLNLIAKIFKVRQCDQSIFSNRTRPCLQFQIKRCSAPCTQEISPSDYAEDIEKTIQFLDGKSQDVLNTLMQQMHDASNDLHFEKAMLYRDQIQQIQKIQNSNYVEAGFSNIDVIVLERAEHLCVIQTLNFREGRLLGSRSFFPANTDLALESEIMEAFLMQYYGIHRLPPVEIILAPNIENQELLSQYLTDLLGKKVSIVASVRSIKQKWLNMTKENARTALRQKLAGQSDVQLRLNDLSHHLGLQKALMRIECFDISHTFGEKTVASNVVYGADGLSKKDYRKFNIEGITPGDDIAAMRQALQRRFKRLETPLPDILLIDGGKSQLNIAYDVLFEAGLHGKVFLLSVAKGEGRKAGLETFWCFDQEHPVDIKVTDPAFYLLLQIRDEAHRFAIEGHRKRRDQARRRSILEDIPNVGPKRREKLIRFFGGLQGVKKASIEDLMKVPGVSKEVAKTIYQALHHGDLEK